MSIRVTIALNTNRTIKSLLLLPADAPRDPKAAKSCHSLVLAGAKTKLRLKKGWRIFVSESGEELLIEEDWRTNLRNDVVLLVSAGEEYVGLRKEAEEDDVKGNADCVVVNLAEKAVVDGEAVVQLENSATTLPGIIHAVGQPDLHVGNKFPIGAVFVSEGWIHPHLIGGDIGCGMAWYRLSLSRAKVDGDKGRKIADSLRGLEGEWASQAAREAWLNVDGECYSADEEWDRSLGTIGAGNHFAEVQVVQASSCDELNEDEVVLLVHSGSRGFGGAMLKKFAPDSGTSFREGSQEAEEYLKAHDIACEWAKANRDLIALRFLCCLEPGCEDWNNQDDESTIEQIQQLRKRIQQRKVVDIWHNNVQKVSWPPIESSSQTLESATESLSINSNNNQKYVYIHRKGAAPTYSPNTGFPLSMLPLPGSRATPTLILRPKFSPQTGWGLKNALSLAHGAGRSMSRTKALSTLSQKYKDTSKLLTPTSASQEHKSQDGSDVHGGTWVICDQKDLVWEEAPEAYKDIYAVAEDLVGSGVAEVVGWCRARVSYKVRVEGR
ncbi:hypothetical protein EJ08DRAFT_238691 [Tothia fuscella]|uniref:3'-phosphate/5'-hydroxy nucleic acid ligase n=1 Tax=Tothia fuscella TaxID=1048955 RepID=A0A9P4NR62_9PEZI|nr:hypothetical protein EJ08DRAFT_238691 [Tothia fuscella]